MAATRTATEGSLHALLEGHRERRWFFVRPLGNWGDHLIYAGAESMARSLGLDWSSHETKDFREVPTAAGDCIYLHGGGGYNTWCSGHSFTNLELALDRPAHLVIQGPVTVGGDIAWLRGRLNAAFAPRRHRGYWFLARDRQTLDILNDSAYPPHGAQTGIDHDTALALTEPDVLALAGLSSMPPGRYSLAARREDNEQPESRRVEHTGDAAAAAHEAVFDPAMLATSFSHWLRIHLLAREIRTNRLHSAILGSIAGKPVSLAPGSYHKNSSVWRFSLQQRGVRWIESLDAPTPWLWSRLPRRLQVSLKLRRALMALRGVPLR